MLPWMLLGWLPALVKKEKISSGDREGEGETNDRIQDIVKAAVNSGEDQADGNRSEQIGPPTGSEPHNQPHGNRN